jgi:hypothetical protein
MKYTTIHSGFSQDRKMPILDKIRLGRSIIKQRADGSQVEYPQETPFFVVPPDVAQIYGAEPTELDVMLPSENVSAVFPQSLAMFGSSMGLKCTGDLQTASRLNEDTGAWEPRACPCEFLKSTTNPKGACTERGTLLVILPKVSVGGCYQIATSSYHGVVAINSALDYIKAVVGRISMVPLKLRRTEKTGYRGSKKTHYPLSLVLEATMAEVQHMRADTMRVLSAPPVRVDEPSMEAPTPVPDGLAEHGPDEVVRDSAADHKPRQDAPAPTVSDPDANPPAFIWRLGKSHAGESIVTIPHSYLKWYAENGKPGDHLGESQKELARRAALP